MDKKNEEDSNGLQRVLKRGLLHVFLLIFRRRCLSSQLPYDIKLIEGLYLTSLEGKSSTKNI